MKPLLTIDEAARYLRVSKTSLRRWTNEGRLECVRVGVRGVRRFRVEALDRFTQSAPEPVPVVAPTGQDPMAALDQAAARGVVRHVSLHHHDRDELWRLFRPYVAWHLERGAPVLWIHEQGERADVLSRLRAEKIAPEELMQRGLLRLLVPGEAYLRTGRFDPERMIDYMEAAILEFRAAGHSTVLISGEMTWSLSGAPGVEGMIEYEGKLNELLRRYMSVTIVCHYDIMRLDGKTTLGALCTHPHAQLADRLAVGFGPT